MLGSQGLRQVAFVMSKVAKTGKQLLSKFFGGEPDRTFHCPLEGRETNRTAARLFMKDQLDLAGITATRSLDFNLALWLTMNMTDENLIVLVQNEFAHYPWERLPKCQDMASQHVRDAIRRDPAELVRRATIVGQTVRPYLPRNWDGTIDMTAVGPSLGNGTH